jgi:hypothetical protein
MKRNILSILMLGVLCRFGAPVVSAAEAPPSAEAQLRERLRATMLQLRTAETDRATLQAAQAQSADEKKALTERLEAITKQANAYKLTAQAVDGLKAEVARQEKEIGQLKETIESGKQAAELARTKEVEQAKRVDEVVIELERLVADRQAKNLALYKIASEILQRYEKFGLGDALTAREPFIGISRVKLENLVQDYQDKLQNERTALDRNVIESNRDKLRNQPPQSPTPISKAASRTSE